MSIIIKPKDDIASAFECAAVPPRSAPRYARLLRQELEHILGAYGLETMERIRDFYLTSNGDLGQLIRELLHEAVGERLRAAQKCAAEGEAQARELVWDPATQAFVKRGTD
jgi:hypothetical protein